MTDVVAGTLPPPAAAGAGGETRRRDAPGGATASLAQAAARGVAWALLAAVGGRLVSLASLSVLARLLSPADFGLVAFALVYMTYVDTVADLGTAAAVIWWPDRREDAAQVSFLTGVVMALGWVALTLAMAPHVAAFFHVPATEPLLRALAWTFLLKALGNTHDALCQKELRFRARALPELGNGLTKAGLSVALAAAGFGAWSLAWGQLAGQAVWTALTWRIVPWRPRWRWPAGVLRPMLAYGRGIASVNVLAAVVHHADLVVVGRLLGATALGLYQVAYKLPETAITVLVWVTSRVLFPTLARLNAEDGTLGRGWLAAVRHVSLLTFPAAAVLAVGATPVVLFVFGPRWAAAGPILAGLAVAAGLRSAGTNAGDVLKAAGRPGLLATLSVVKAAVLLPALLLAARGGPAAVAWTMAAVTVVTATLGVAVSARYAHVSLAAFGAAMAPAAGVALCVGASAWLALQLGPAPLPLALLASAAVFLLSARVLAPDVVGDAWRTLRGPVGGPRRAGRLVAGGPDRGLLGFLLKELYVPHTRAQRMIRTLPESVGRGVLLRPAAAREKPWPSVARTALRGHGELAAALEDDRWIACERVTGRPEQGALLALFDEGGAAPRAALKLRPARGRPLLHEADVLLALRARLPRELSATLPRPLAYEHADGWEALLLPWMPGRSAYVGAHAALRPDVRRRAHLEAAVDWLAALQRCTSRPAKVDAEGIGALRGIDVPVAVAHGDYWARNILLEGGAVSAVLDWEHARDARPVTDDLFHLVLTHALDGQGRGRIEPVDAFRRAFLEPTPEAHEIARVLLRHCAASRVDPRLLRPLFELHLETSATGQAPSFRDGLRAARWTVFSE